MPGQYNRRPCRPSCLGRLHGSAAVPRQHGVASRDGVTSAPRRQVLPVRKLLALPEQNLPLWRTGSLLRSCHPWNGVRTRGTGTRALPCCGCPSPRVRIPGIAGWHSWDQPSSKRLCHLRAETERRSQFPAELCMQCTIVCFADNTDELRDNIAGRLAGPHGLLQNCGLFFVRRHSDPGG